MIQIFVAGMLATAEVPTQERGMTASSPAIRQDTPGPEIIRQIRCFAQTIEPLAEGQRRDRNPLLLVNEQPYGPVFQASVRCSGKETLPRGVTSVEYLIPSAAREAFGKAAAGGLVRVDYTRPRPRG